MEKSETGRYLCVICGYIYDPEENDGVAFEDLDEYWRCPKCKRGKQSFNKVK